MTNTILLTDDAKLHGSHWLADIPIRVGSPTAEQLRSVQGVRAPITIGPFHADDAIVFLTDVTGSVETWRVYKAADTAGLVSEGIHDTNNYHVGDTIEVVKRAYTDFGPSVGHRAAVHPPGDGKSFPSWTFTAAACVYDNTHAATAAEFDQLFGPRGSDGPQPEKMPRTMPLHSTREAMRALPDWEVGNGMSAAEAIRELAWQRDEARERLAKQDRHAGWYGDDRARVAHDLRTFVASTRWTDSPTHGIELSTEDASKLLTRSERRSASLAVLRDAIELLDRVRRDPGRQTAHEIEALVARCRAALEVC